MNKTDKFVVTVWFTVKTGFEAQFRNAVIEQARNSLELETSCQVFDVCEHPEHPGQVFLYEIYDDEAAFKTHLESPHFHYFNQQTRDWLESKQVSTWHQMDIQNEQE